MTWKLLLIIIAFLIYIIYNILTIKYFGIPHSLSQTYYLFKEKKEWMKILFPLMMILVGLLLMPSWITLSEGNTYQFTAFLAIMGVMFTGACPTFKNSKMEDKIHTYSAYFAACMAILWIILVSKTFYILLIIGIILLLCAFIFNEWKGKLTYWLETMVLLTTFISLLNII